MIRAAHFSWIGPYSPAMERRAKTDAKFRARCDALVRLMGYQFRIATVTLPATVRRGQPLALSVTGENEGVAPFYYPWQVQAVLLNADGTVREAVPLPRADIRKWQPGAFITTDAPRFTAPPGTLPVRSRHSRPADETTRYPFRQQNRRDQRRLARRCRRHADAIAFA